MRFNVAALAEAVDQVLVENQEVWASKVQEAKAQTEQERREWLEEYADQWRALARLITRRLAKGQAIVHEDLPTNGNRFVAVFRSSARTLAPYRDDPNLVAFRRLLATVADETVTSAGLKELGVTPATMRQVTATLAPRSVAG
jgi:hypothetical protein